MNPSAGLLGQDADNRRQSQSPVKTFKSRTNSSATALHDGSRPESRSSHPTNFEKDPRNELEFIPGSGILSKPYESYNQKSNTSNNVNYEVFGSETHSLDPPLQNDYANLSQSPVDALDFRQNDDTLYENEKRFPFVQSVDSTFRNKPNKPDLGPPIQLSASGSRRTSGDETGFKLGKSDSEFTSNIFSESDSERGCIGDEGELDSSSDHIADFENDDVDINSNYSASNSLPTSNKPKHSSRKGSSRSSKRPSYSDSKQKGVPSERSSYVKEGPTLNPVYSQSLNSTSNTNLGLKQSVQTNNQRSNSRQSGHNSISNSTHNTQHVNHRSNSHSQLPRHSQSNTQLRKNSSVRARSSTTASRPKFDGQVPKYRRMADQEQSEKLYDALRALEKEQNSSIDWKNGYDEYHSSGGKAVDTDSFYSHAQLLAFPPPHVQLQPLSTSPDTKPNVAIFDEKIAEAISPTSAPPISLLTEIHKDISQRPKPHALDLTEEKRQISDKPINNPIISTNSTANRPLTLWRYLLLELGSQSSQYSAEEKTEQLDNFIRLPFYLERVVIFGCLACFDSFLYIFTILPLRFVYGIYKIGFRVFGVRHGRIPVTRKADIIKGIILILVLYLLMQLDTSKIYHGIRGQSAIKLYVMFNVLEVADKLCSALGQDILDCLFSATTLSISANPRSLLLRNIARPFIFMILAIIYIYAHSVAILYQTISLNIAVNSYSDALLTLILSNQFSEIKSTVFKKFERENLFQLTCADVAERFQLSIMMLIIGIRNVVEVSSTGLVPRSWSGWNRWFGALFGPMIIVVGSEVVVDWLKHAYIAKFNNIRPKVYRKFLDVLVYDYSDNSFSDHIMTKRIGIPIIPLAAVFLRMLFQSYSILVENQQSSTFATPSETYIPNCAITSFAETSLVNETILSGDETLSTLISTATTVSSVAVSSVKAGVTNALEEHSSSNTTLFSTVSSLLFQLVPGRFSNLLNSSYYSCQYASWISFISSYMPESADSFYSTVSLILIFLTSFVLLFFIKLTLGLFLLQYTYKRRATMIAKSKLQPLPSQVHAQGSLSVPGPLNPTTTFVQSNSNPQTAPGTAVPITNSSVPPVSASTVPATPITRGRSSSQITHGSRRQSISHTRNAASAGVPASGTLPGSSSTKLSSLPTSNIYSSTNGSSNNLSTYGTSGSSTGISTGVNVHRASSSATSHGLNSGFVSQATNANTASARDTSGYDSDESDHVPGPIKGQGVVEVNEAVRERMYDHDEAVPPPKPRKTNVKEFKDLFKIQRFKMTAKQIW